MSQTATQEDSEVDYRLNTYRPFYFPFITRTCDVSLDEDKVFLQQPVLAPLLFENESSDARDHCANERNFLSYLRLSIYMSIVSLAIILSFHLKSSPSELESRIALPLGLVFWFLGMATLALGYGNYVKTVKGYARRAALVQTGWKTQVVFGGVAVSIVTVCVLLLITGAERGT